VAGNFEYDAARYKRKAQNRMAINETLQRQIQQALGIGNPAQLDEFLAAALAELPGVTPVARQGRLGLQSLLEQVDCIFSKV
jgi:hypothetical protein